MDRTQSQHCTPKEHCLHEVQVPCYALKLSTVIYKQDDGHMSRESVIILLQTLFLPRAPKGIRHTISTVISWGQRAGLSACTGKHLVWSGTAQISWYLQFVKGFAARDQERL